MWRWCIVIVVAAGVVVIVANGEAPDDSLVLVVEDVAGWLDICWISKVCINASSREIER